MLVFNKVSKSSILAVVDLRLEDVAVRLRPGRITLDVETDAMAELLCKLMAERLERVDGVKPQHTSRLCHHLCRSGTDSCSVRSQTTWSLSHHVSCIIGTQMADPTQNGQPSDNAGTGRRDGWNGIGGRAVQPVGEVAV